MRVWVVSTDAGMARFGVFGIATDASLAATVRAAGADLRARYKVEGGQFTVVTNKEPYYRDDERVYRNGWMTIIVRPFELGDPE